MSNRGCDVVMAVSAGGSENARRGDGRFQAVCECVTAVAAITRRRPVRALHLSGAGQN